MESVVPWIQEHWGLVAAAAAALLYGFGDKLSPVLVKILEAIAATAKAGSKKLSKPKSTAAATPLPSDPAPAISDADKLRESIDRLAAQLATVPPAPKRKR